MKKYIGFGLIFAMSAMLAIPGLRAAEETAEGMPTQADLARLLVNVLGLSVDLPVTPSDTQVFAALLANKIAPAESWNATSLISQADLARVVVQAMGEADQIENPDDPQAWVTYLKGLGIPIDTVGQAVAGVNPLQDPVVAPVTVTDPLNTVGADPGSLVYGAPVADPAADDVNIPAVATVVATITEVQAIIQEATKPKSVTTSEVTPN